MMGLSDGRKNFPIGLAVLIQYRSVKDTQPATQPRCRSYYAQRSGVEPKNDVIDVYAVAALLVLTCYCLHVLTRIICKITETEKLNNCN